MNGAGPIWGGWWFWEPPPGKTKETERGKEKLAGAFEQMSKRLEEGK